MASQPLVMLSTLPELETDLAHHPTRVPPMLSRAQKPVPGSPPAIEETSAVYTSTAEDMEDGWRTDCEQYLDAYARGLFDPTTTPAQPSFQYFPMPDYYLSSSNDSSEEDDEENAEVSSWLNDMTSRDDMHSRLSVRPSHSPEMLEYLAAPAPPNEKARLSVLYKYRLLHTAPDVNFDRIVNMAAKVFNAEICLVSLVHTDGQWHKSETGLGADSNKRSLSLCSHTILVNTGEPLVVLDATKDWRFAKNPSVLGPPHIRFYAGAPLYNKEGLALGALCIVDSMPREKFTAHEQELLTHLAASVMHEMDLWADSLRYRSLKRMQDKFGEFQKAYLHNKGSFALSDNANGDNTNQRRPGHYHESAAKTAKPSKDYGSVDFGKACQVLMDSVEADLIILAQIKPVCQSTPLTPNTLSTITNHISLFDPRLGTIHEREDKSTSRSETFVVSSATDERASICLSRLAGHTAASKTDEASKPGTCVDAIISDDDIFTSLQLSPSVNKIIRGKKARQGRIYASKLPFTQPTSIADPYRTAMIVPMLPITPQTDTNPDGIHQVSRSAAAKAAMDENSVPFGLIVVLSKNPYWIFESEEHSFCYNFGITIVSQVMQQKVIVADRAKSAFISSISHELRTPLHGILGTVDLMAATDGKPLDSEQELFLGTIRTSTKMLASIVNNVLDLAKLEKGVRGQIMLQDSVHLVDLVKEVGKIANGEGSKQQVKLFISVDDEIWEEQASAPSDTTKEASWPKHSQNAVYDWQYAVKANAECLKRVLLNLLDNAFKFTNEGYVHLGLSRPDLPPRCSDATYQNVSGNQSESIAADDTPSESKLLYPYIFTIRDTGIGISKSYMSSTLFQSFSQQDSLRHGIGLGLRISSELVRLMGGHIEVRSSDVPGDGSTFKVVVYCEQDDGIHLTRQ